MALEIALLHDQHLNENETLPDIQPVHKTICKRCGRALTNPISVARGIGPKCARTVAYETRRSIETPSYTYTTRTLHYFLGMDQLETELLPADHPAKYLQHKKSTTLKAEHISNIQKVKSSSKLIPECNSCHASLVYGRFAKQLSKQQNRDIFYCNSCVTQANKSMQKIASTSAIGK